VGENPQCQRLHGQLLGRRVGNARADVTRSAFTITGSAYGINSDHPDKVVTTDFKVAAEC